MLRWSALQSRGSDLLFQATGTVPSQDCRSWSTFSTMNMKHTYPCSERPWDAMFQWCFAIYSQSSQNGLRPDSTSSFCGYKNTVHYTCRCNGALGSGPTLNDHAVLQFGRLDRLRVVLENAIRECRANGIGPSSILRSRSDSQSASIQGYVKGS